MRVTIRADATRESGTGHVMRCWALAEEFEARGASVTWQSTIDVPWLCDAVRQRNWQVSVPQGTTLEQAKTTNADLVIVDSYTIDYRYRQTLLERGIYVVAIVDDSVADAGPAHLWVNPGAPSNLEVERASAFLNGPEYVLIRKQVRELRTLREQAENEGAGLNGITFLLGGTDSVNFSGVISEIAHRQSYSRPIFAGPVQEPYRSNSISWLSGGPDLLKRAAKSNLVLSAAGVSSWELAHIGVPLALYQAAGNQSGNFEWMTKRGWAWPLGVADMGSNATDFAEQISQALDAIENGQLVGVARVDGLGVQRVVDASLTQCLRAGG